MRFRFLIIGFTGAIGSGCSELARFLQNGMVTYQGETRLLHRKITTAISEHYRELKSMRTQYEEDARSTLSQRDDLDISANDYRQMLSDQMESPNHEIIAKGINRKLRTFLIKRKIYDYFSSTSWEPFVHISMSCVLMAKIVRDSVADSGTSHPVFPECQGITESGKSKILKFAQQHVDSFQEFDEIIKNKDYKEFTPGFCKKFDEFFEAVKGLKKSLILSGEVESQWFQDMGDNVRCYGHAFPLKTAKKTISNLDRLSVEANKIIKYYRNRKDGGDLNHFAIESFRNPAEVRFFKKRYGSFYLCSVFASLEDRKKRLAERYDERIDERDQGASAKPNELYKQNVTGCTLLADYAITNMNDKEYYKYGLVRLLALIDRPGYIPPSTDEVFMNFAYTISLRSTCLSRQVGAVITNQDGFVIAAGWNDVGSGQMGCSLNCIDDYKKYSDSEYLLENWHPFLESFDKAGLFDSLKGDNYFCFKDLQSSKIVKEKIRAAIFNYYKVHHPDEPVHDVDSIADEISSKISVKRLEYARSLHAEENAILQAARFGGMGISGGTIYTTTYPCELCSKKIYQAQLKRVVYTEPYPGGLSEQVFLKDGVRTIAIEQFEGVKSPSFHRLFKSPFDMKEFQLIEPIIKNSEI